MHDQLAPDPREGTRGQMPRVRHGQVPADCRKGTRGKLRRVIRGQVADDRRKGRSGKLPGATHEQCVRAGRLGGQARQARAREKARLLAEAEAAATSEDVRTVYVDGPPP